jgi:hypothetical protein
MQDMRWDHGLKVTADGNGLVGHAGAVLLRVLADRTGLTGEHCIEQARCGDEESRDGPCSTPETRPLNVTWDDG